MYNKRGQVTIFIIIAIIIVGVVVGFFLLRENLSIKQIPASIQPVYSSFLSCLEDKTQIGISVLESQAGYITLPSFEPGSAYMPFSSQLNFLGNPIPYWYYISGNNIQKEQIPSQADMEKALAGFIDEKITECDFDNYYQEGFEINQKNPKASVTINKDNVVVKLNMDMEITKGEDNVLITNHEATVQSSLGNLYNSAKIIYEKEQKELFLENYGIDTLRLYAPVDGVDLTCSPETWNADEVFSKLQDAIETNTLALSTKDPSTKDAKYFFVSGIGDNVRFINSRNWSSSFEVNPSQENILIASPVGNQAGLGILGFCYVPYHFVYNVKYPVLVQIYNGNEIFQFPVAVVIQGNKPRVGLNSTATSSSSELCAYKNSLTNVQTYDTSLNPVDAQISYECFGDTCSIGETSSGTLTEQFPQCVNGYIIARADGFKEERYMYSTTQEGGSASIIMDKLYNLNVNLNLNGQPYNGKAIIYFDSESDSKAVSYPEKRTVKLSEGDYNISVYIYKDSSINIQETTHQECTNVPVSGIGGILGMTEKKCFDIKVPSQIISNALAGGGKQEHYFFESDLKESSSIEINAESLSVPTTMQQLQDNYLLFDSNGLGVSMK